jgi:hypothetical protein
MHLGLFVQIHATTKKKVKTIPTNCLLFKNSKFYWMVIFGKICSLGFLNINCKIGILKVENLI